MSATMKQEKSESERKIRKSKTVVIGRHGCSYKSCKEAIQNINTNK